MKTIQLKTNINCSGCVAKAAPSLNETVGAATWEVDTQTPKKVLTVTTDNLDEQEIIKAVEKAGFKAEALS